MFIGSRVEPEWRVEGESHSLTDALCFWLLPCMMARLGEASQPSESIMGLFKGVHLGVANLKVHIMLWDYSVIPLCERLHSGPLRLKGLHGAAPY